MSYLLRPQSNQSSATHPTSISEATERLKGLAAKKKAVELKQRQLVSERENEDMKQHFSRKEEDEKYTAVLAGRPCENEQIRKKRKAEDSKIYHDEGLLEDEIAFYRHYKRQLNLPQKSSTLEPPSCSAVQLPSQILRNSANSSEADKCLQGAILATESSTPVPAKAAGSDDSRSAEATYLCSFCDGRFKTKTSRDKHEVRHQGEKSAQHLCVEADCGKSFYSGSHLKRHVNSMSFAPSSPGTVSHKPL